MPTFGSLFGQPDLGLRQRVSSGSLIPLSNAMRMNPGYQPGAPGQGIQNYGGTPYVERSGVMPQRSVSNSPRPSVFPQPQAFSRSASGGGRVPLARPGSMSSLYPDMSVYPTVNAPGQAPPPAAPHVPPQAQGTMTGALRDLLPQAAAPPQPRPQAPPSGPPGGGAGGQGYGPMIAALMQLLGGGGFGGPSGGGMPSGPAQQQAPRLMPASIPPQATPDPYRGLNLPMDVGTARIFMNQQQPQQPNTTRTNPRPRPMW